MNQLSFLIGKKYSELNFEELKQAICIYADINNYPKPSFDLDKHVYYIPSRSDAIEVFEGEYYSEHVLEDFINEWIN